MASSSAIIIQETGLKGVLTSAFSAAATSLTVQFVDIQSGLARTPQSGTLLFTIDQDNASFETILASSHSTTNGITTITIATNGRALPKYGSGVGSATGTSHIAGAAIGCVDVAYPINLLEANKLNIDGTNVMTSALPLAALTTAQRTALTPANGSVVYDSDIGEGYIFQAGSWQPLQSGSTQPNASETVAGKVELATNAEMGTATSTGGTGARLVPPNDQLTATSAGAGSANKIPVLSSIGQLDSTFGISPVGSVLMYVGSSAPTNWLFCDGASYLRADYAALFTIISTTYGSADGTHFNVPDLRGRIPIGVGTGTGGGAAGTGLPTGGSALTAIARATWKGEETHTMTTGELVAHTHGYVEHLTVGDGTFLAGATGAAGANTVVSNSTGSTTPFNVIQPTMGLNFIIKT